MFVADFKRSKAARKQGAGQALVQNGCTRLKCIEIFLEKQKR